MRAEIDEFGNESWNNESSYIIFEMHRNSGFEKHDDAPTYWRQESQAVFWVVDNWDFPNVNCQVPKEQSLVKVHFKVIYQVKPSIWKTSE